MDESTNKKAPSTYLSNEEADIFHFVYGILTVKKDKSIKTSKMSKSKYLRNNETISGRLHDEMVMMDIQKGKYFSLNPVATIIWDLLEQPLSIEELCERLMDEYEIGYEQCKKEVEEYLMEMNKLGLVV